MNDAEDELLEAELYEARLADREAADVARSAGGMFDAILGRWVAWDERGPVGKSRIYAGRNEWKNRSLGRSCALTRGGRGSGWRS